jgi:glyoxylase-like metal-dependent hydrolase (beta-lactamase superfamily II)
MLHIVTIDAGGDANRSYLIYPEHAQEAWCVDPSYAAGAILDTCSRDGKRLTEVLLTHTHGDHVATLDRLRAGRDLRVWIHPLEAAHIKGAVPLPGEGPIPGLGGAEAIHTPGHTPGGVCYRVGGALFTGDLLFVDWIGRTDLPGGDPAAMFQSLAKLRTLPPELAIHPGHHYGSVESRSLGEELAANKFLACTDYAAFLRLLPELTA